MLVTVVLAGLTALLISSSAWAKSVKSDSILCNFDTVSVVEVQLQEEHLTARKSDLEWLIRLRLQND